MEVWTFINKYTNNIIRFETRAGCIEFGTQYYFTESVYSPLWFIENEDEAKLAYCENVHPQYSMFFSRPATDKININNYEIKKFVL